MSRRIRCSGTCSRERASHCRHHMSMPSDSVAYWVVQHQEPLVISIRGRRNPVSGSHRLPAKPRHPVGMCAAPDIAAAPSRHAVSRQPGTPRRTMQRISRFCRLSRIRLRSPSRTRRTTRRCSTRSRSSETACGTSRRATNCCARCPRSSTSGGCFRKSRRSPRPYSLTIF